MIVSARACREKSEFVALGPVVVPQCSIKMRTQRREDTPRCPAQLIVKTAHKPSHVSPNVGNVINANISRLIHWQWWDEEIKELPQRLARLWARMHCSPLRLGTSQVTFLRWSFGEIRMYQRTSSQRVSSLIRSLPATPLHFSRTTSSPRRTTSISTWQDIKVAGSAFFSTLCEGERILCCPYCYADNDVALMRGWIEGYPRQFGSVYQTRTFAVASPTSVQLTHGGRFAAYMSAHGQLLIKARVTLCEKVERLVRVLDSCVVGRRYFPSSHQACMTIRPWMSSFDASQISS
jgi:hypothetical protein